MALGGDETGQFGHPFWQPERRLMISLRVVGTIGIGVGIDGIRTRDEEQGAAHRPGQHTEHQHRGPWRFADHRIRHSVWNDVESIRSFAGERWQEAVITPDEEHLLKDTWISHYETIEAG
jgi:hypothetical protein